MKPIDEFAKMVRKSVEVVGSQFTSPNDDWERIVIMRSGKQATIVQLESTQETKDNLRPILTDIFRLYVPDYVAVIISAHYVTIPIDNPLGEDAIAITYALGISNHPDRKECLNVIVASPDEEQVWWADIKRSPDKPPTLDEWITPENRGNKILEAIRAGFRATERIRKRKRRE